MSQNRRISIIRHQPTNTENRRPIPISTIDWHSTLSSHILPVNGLDFLLGVEKVVIQQSVELPDVMDTSQSTNKYTIKVPRGETIYYASETSRCIDRSLFKSGRPFTLNLHDPTQQIALTLKRRLACGVLCNFCCYLQRLEVWGTCDQYIGYIQQVQNFRQPIFYVVDSADRRLYLITCQESSGLCSRTYRSFQIYDDNGLVQLGSIVHQWDSTQVSYNLLVQLPERTNDSKKKALLLGAAFLVQYLYFDVTPNSKWTCLC